MTSENQDPWDEGTPVPLYVITGGPGSSAKTFNLVTLIAARSEPEPAMQPEQAAILSMCTYPLSVAEVSAYLSLPFSVVTVLLSKLVDDERVEAIAPVPVAAYPERGLLEAVIHGLRKL
ncbi:MULTISPECIES: DUF742 domain-containing protein [unclassified Streptomyces]|uniref:DUF742 domain-containing protein n=1 Tax=unclassified Streptomyces TaxID=2593676 RepID=UPI001BED1D35|nr:MULTISPECIES: DUF742 domain-containing protein [unclassified Streptomyces]MBT2403115.1 DUF742 domain-containing protein [Streptomyces sp. ISL-21]MBT2457581.1 DUF742 domain-containing protein [Streptomyces sp. ISL-86]MBT2610208.1 DUF742 domain-containing protein [Streptomyces sp. ISL-87]